MELTKLILLFCLVLMSLSKGNAQQLSPVSEGEEQVNQQLESRSEDSNYGIFRKLNKLTNNLHQCFCYLQKSNGVPVTQMLSPNKKNLERLVVYLYKDESSDNVKIYLPNIEKQRMIPDLAFDRGDIIEMLPSDEIESMYNKHSDLATNRTRFESPDIAPVASAATLNHNVPNIFDIIEANNMIIFNKDEKLVPSQETQTSNYDTKEHQPDQNSNMAPNRHIIQHEEQINEINSNPDEFPKKVNKIYDPQILNNLMKFSAEIPITNQVLDNALENSNNVVEEEPNEIEFREPEVNDVTPNSDNVQQNFDLNRKPETLSVKIKDEAAGPILNFNNINIRPNTLTNIGKDQFIKPNLKVTLEPNQGIKHIVPHLEVVKPETVEHTDHVTWPQSPEPTIISTTNNPIDTNTNTPQYIVINTLKPKDIDRATPYPFNINKKLMNGPNRKIVSTVLTDGPNVWYNKLQNPRDMSVITLQPQRLVKNYHEKEPNKFGEINLYDKFDNWFNQQLELVQFADSEASNSLDIYTFKHLIEKTLRKNGFYITETGLLVDSNGVEIDTANLVLRPILIGNSVEYKRLLHDMVGSFKLPKDMPYLEAVLITSINPQKILGIIPLGKTYLPKKFRNPLSLYVGDEARQGCNSCDLKKLLGSRLRHKSHSPYSGRYNNRHRPYSWMVSQNKPYSPDGQSYGVNRILTKPSNRYLKSGRRIFPFDQINTMIDRVYKLPLGADRVKVVSRPETYVVGYERPTVVTGTVPVLKYPITVTEVTPGFRIIGGNAATSSGTPVSSKGRSGLNAEDLTGIDSESVTPLP